MIPGGKIRGMTVIVGLMQEIVARPDKINQGA